MDKGQNGRKAADVVIPIVHIDQNLRGLVPVSPRVCPQNLFINGPGSRSPLTRIPSVEIAKEKTRSICTSIVQFPMPAPTRRKFDRSMALYSAPKIFSLAERAPAHRRVKLVTEPQTKLHCKENSPMPRDPCLHFFIDCSVDGSGSDINLLWAWNPQTQISPTPQILRVASCFARLLCVPESGHKRS